MNTIVHFELPALSYRCVLNPRGRRRYGTLEQLCASGNGVQSTVGIADGSRVLDTSLRNSIQFKSVFLFNLNTIQTIEAKLKDLDGNAYWLDGQQFDVIEYSQGGFFKEHQDKQINDTHYGTLLLFPPGFAHTGGDLVLNRGEFVFESSTNTSCKCIAFPTNTIHECKEVLSGKRLVLKTELFRRIPLLPRDPVFQFVD